MTISPIVNSLFGLLHSMCFFKKVFILLTYRLIIANILLIHWREAYVDFIFEGNKRVVTLAYTARLHLSWLPCDIQSPGQALRALTQGKQEAAHRHLTCYTENVDGAIERSQGNCQEGFEYWFAWAQYPKVFQLPCVYWIGTDQVQRGCRRRENVIMHLNWSAPI